MKKKIVLPMLLFSFFVCTRSQSTGRDKPFTKPLGRVVQLRLIAYANDGTGKFIFKHPSGIVLLEDGSFLLIDNTRVIKFDTAGKFSKIFVQKGLGPGEALYLNQLYLLDNQLVVNTGIMAKLMIFDLEGNLKSENKRRNNPAINRNTLSVGESSLEIIGNTNDRHFIVINRGSLANKSDIKEGLSWKPVFLLSETNELKKLLFEIPLKAIFIDTPMGKKTLDSFGLESTHDNENIYYCNTERYEIKVYNISTNKVVSSWKRNYTPVPIPEDGRNKYQFGQQLMVNTGEKSINYAAPVPRNFPDIQELCIVENKLWVITSTVEQEKGLLVDVFDKNGNFIDHFYLFLRGKLDLHRIEMIAIRGKNVYVRELDEEENFMVVKYEMINHL